MSLRSWIVIVLISLGFVAFACALATAIAYVGSHSFGEWQLVFQQLTSRWRWASLCGICGVAVGLMVKLHEYERQLVSPLLGTTLLSLRLGLVLIIFLTLLEPVWTWSYNQETRGRVAVAIDVSESMETRDRHALLAEKLRWARALGMFAKHRDQVDGWIRDLEADGEPVWVTAEEEPDPVRRQQLARQRQQDIQATLEAVTDYSRLELVAKAFATAPDPPIDRLEEYTQPEFAIFAGDHTDADRQLLRDISEGTELPIKRSSTELSAAVNAALKSDSEIPLAAIVVFSDGRETSEVESKQLVQRLAGLGVPVHTVLAGSVDRPRDIAVAHVDAPDSVFEDDTPLAKAIVHAFGFEGEEITVFLDNLDDPQSEPLEQTVAVDAPTLEVALTLDKLKQGRHRFRIRTDVQERELREDNNSREFTVNVVDDRAHVLLIDGEGRWEFRYLLAALQRDKRVSVEEVLFEQPYLGILDEPFFQYRLQQLDTGSNETTRYSDFDCVVIGDVAPRHLTLADWRQLEKNVREEGGTIVMTAGKRYFPMAYRGTVVSSLLPIENLRVIDLHGAAQTLPPRQRGFRFSITPDGEQLAMFQLADDLDESRRIWRELPGHSWGMTGDAKGGATVFAAALNPGEQLTLENEREKGIVVQHYVGEGQVLWVGVDSTWRWRFRVGDLYHHRFWGQLVRWAVSFKATAANKNVKLALTKSVLNEGDTTRIQVRWDERFLAQHPQLQTAAIIESTDGANFRKRVDLKPAENRGFLHEADINDLTAGEYRVTLEVPEVDWADDLPEAPLVVRELVSRELADISANKVLLEEIASATGGRFFQLDEIDQLPELFVDTQDVSEIHEEIPLWNHWLILVLFSIVAMAEWVLRKLNGLP